MRLKKTLFTFLCAGSLLGQTACETEKDKISDFDQAAMLENYSENLMLSNIATYNTSVSALATAVNAFVGAQNEANLLAAQEALLTAYTDWALVDGLQFGPAEEQNFFVNSNTFPARFDEIEASIESGSWDLSSVFAKDEKGLAALDYLLFNGETSADILEGFENTSRQNYLKEVAEDLSSSAMTLLDAWRADSGNYAAEFAANTGNDPSSSLGFLINEFNKSYERSKNQRLGYPMGKNSLAGIVTPKTLEGYYSKQSLRLLKANVTAVENLFKGQYGETNGLGLDDYLTSYTEAGIIDKDLSKEILAQFELIHSKLDALADPLADQLEAEDSKLEELYVAMKDMTFMIKSEMSTALGVSITYQDSDGD
ncbi:imelysin family protein [Sediminitomix flava]|uniref:Imelysin-like domain-containing protein n=1 Tax=Sediminitomix flava TaxID=379075 RepID=A0A315ZUQ4_SEDFL|nr:imelysin family protein [Sediminitomix flava]PWJ39379.1 hypothetical protein BC781_106280 [Sediminitomix flava]